MKIVDCFPYFNEKELLELRINLLYDYVDKIIICEGDHTQSGIRKEFTCKKIIEELNLPTEKIIVVEVNMPSLSEEKNSWVREQMQRNAATPFINEDDVCFVSDCDEIINPTLIEYYAITSKSNPDKILRVPLVYLNGRADLRVYDELGNPRRWDTPFMCLKSHLENITLSQIRESYSMERYDVPFSDIFITEQGIVKDAGWHFSWMGSSKIMKEKSLSSMHVQDFVIGSVAQFGTKEMMDFLENYKPKENSTDPLGRKDHILKKYPVENLPKKIFELKRVKNFLLPENKIKILFHDNQLGERGTSVAMFDYAFYLKKFLNVEPFITWNKNSPNNNLDVILKFSKEFYTVPYEDFNEVESIIKQHNIEYFYAIKSGEKDNIIVKNAKNLIHSVYCTNPLESHGEIYSTVSKWQSLRSDYKIPFVPHMINLPYEDKNLRKDFKIPKNDLVVGRYGGMDTFDVPFIWDSINEILSRRNNMWFIFMNTPKSINHPRCIFLNANVDLNYKTQFINTCDAMIHAGFRGETFGLAILEFASKNKQIIMFDNYVGGKNHFLFLNGNFYLYKEKFELDNIFLNLSKENPFNTLYLNEMFSPERVISKFKEVFLPSL